MDEDFVLTYLLVGYFLAMVFEDLLVIEVFIIEVKSYLVIVHCFISLIVRQSVYMLGHVCSFVFKTVFPLVFMKLVMRALFEQFCR